jgi:UDP-N-acetyl-2-amino-2-deoxyglucuronate dehydrogenase
LKKIKFGVLGGGNIGKKHLRILQAHPDVDLLAYADPIEIVDINIPRYLTLDEMLEKHPELEVINICTPNGYHAKQAILCLKADKHIIVEKPMGLNKSECEAIISTALNVHKHVFVVMQNRFSPAIIWLKEQIELQKFGSIYQVELRAFWNRDERYYNETHNWRGTKNLDGGPLFTQFAHFIDIVYWIFGNIKHIKSVFYKDRDEFNTAFEDGGLIQFEFIKGGRCTFHYSTSIWNKNFESSISVIGSQGTAKISGQYMNEITYAHLKDQSMTQIPKFDQENTEYHKNIFDNVIDTLRKKDNPHTNAIEGLKVVEIIEQIYAQL